MTFSKLIKEYHSLKNRAALHDKNKAYHYAAILRNAAIEIAKEIDRRKDAARMAGAA